MIQSSVALLPFLPTTNYSTYNGKPLLTKALITRNSITSIAYRYPVTAQNYEGIRSEKPLWRQACGQSSDSTSPSDSFFKSRLCSCGRRCFIGASGAPLLRIFPAKATGSESDPASDLSSYSKATLNKVHPPRPDWYEELYAYLTENCTKSYEAQIAGYKTELFENLKGKSKNILELGIGTGPNLKYYASDAGVSVFGVDPNKKMEKYAQAAGVAAGLPLSRFNFIQAVGEALPVADGSMDAVVGTLVLCSVGDVTKTLKELKRVLKPGGLYLFVEHVAAQDRSALRFMQGLLDPLQQFVSDGCHLARETGKDISNAGFSEVTMNTVLVPKASVASPHVYGIACK